MSTVKDSADVSNIALRKEVSYAAVFRWNKQVR